MEVAVAETERAGIDQIPRWHVASPAALWRMRPALRRWILHKDSMVRALQQWSGSLVQVRVLRDRSGQLLPDEAMLLGRRRGRARVREVVLYAGRLPVLAARTVCIARRLLAHSQLISLGRRALGELLFAHGRPRWLQREHARIGPGMRLDSLVRQAVPDPPAFVRRCHARRTLFLFDGLPLLVTEIFLPAMLHRLSGGHSTAPVSEAGR